MASDRISGTFLPLPLGWGVRGGGDVFEREQLVRAWASFVRGKSGRADVEAFTLDLEENLEQLYQELRSQTYRHGSYRRFVRCDPKRRVIAVPSVRDQIVHHLLVAASGPSFERQFHPHSYASRPGKGVLASVGIVHRWISAMSDRGRQRCWALRMDIASYFASVDHAILNDLLARRFGEPWRWLATEIIASYGEDQGGRRCGIPLGNLTSQLFANVYLHELDRFVMHDLRMRRYARYMDDWIMIGRDYGALTRIAVCCQAFLRDALRLDAPERKTSLTPVHRGVDWLGFVLFPHHHVLRPTTVQRLRHRVRERVIEHLDGGLSRGRLRATFASYDGLLSSAFQERERERLRLLDRCVG